MEFNNTYAQKDKDNAFNKAAKVVHAYSDEMVKRWNMEIDVLLVFVSIYTIYSIYVSETGASHNARLACSPLY